MAIRQYLNSSYKINLTVPESIYSEVPINVFEELIFDNLADSISILETDLELLFNGNFDSILNEIFTRNIYNKNEFNGLLKLGYFIH